ncbi:MAG TPA: hypothetical protein VI488_02355 [Candidatus Angelobacter sp.]
MAIRNKAKKRWRKPDFAVCVPPHHSRAPHMKKDSEEEQKPLFQVWLEAYNNRLIEIAQSSPGAKASGLARPSDQDGPQLKPSPGTST